jgi:hypothetical protein
MAYVYYVINFTVDVGVTYVAETPDSFYSFAAGITAFLFAGCMWNSYVLFRLKKKKMRWPRLHLLLINVLITLPALTWGIIALICDVAGIPDNPVANFLTNYFSFIIRPFS